MKVLHEILKRTSNCAMGLSVVAIVFMVDAIAVAYDTLTDDENMDCSRKVSEKLKKLTKRF